MIKVMINGMPGNVAKVIADHTLRDNRFELLPYSFTGPEITEDTFHLEKLNIKLIRPDIRDSAIEDIKKDHGPFVTVDYTHPSAVNENAIFYCTKNLPFVMGTTGGDRTQLLKTVANSSIPAVIAPNMVKQIVGFQAMMAYAADSFPNLFKGFTLELKESHQQGKADTSGTAKAMVGYFNQLGIPFTSDDIIKERDPEKQKNEWGIPEEYIKGHGWHTYTLTSKDKTAAFTFSHNINGRDIYSSGTHDAILFIQEQINKGVGGKVFTMMDVLKGGQG